MIEPNVQQHVIPTNRVLHQNEGERMLSAVEGLDRADPSYPFQRSLLTGYATLGKLFCEDKAQYQVDQELDELEAAIRKGDEEARQVARMKLKAKAHRADRARDAVSTAAFQLRDAAQRMAEVASEAIRLDSPEGSGT